MKYMTNIEFTLTTGDLHTMLDILAELIDNKMEIDLNNEASLKNEKYKRLGNKLNEFLYNRKVC